VVLLVFVCVVVRMFHGRLLLGQCIESTKEMPSWHQGSTAHCSITPLWGPDLEE
jgi:hypothetical protein